MDRREEEIRRIAYSLWVREGRCRGKAVEHWLKAEAIWEKDHEGKEVLVPAGAGRDRNEPTWDEE